MIKELTNWQRLRIIMRNENSLKDKNIHKTFIKSTQLKHLPIKESLNVVH